MTTSSSNTTCTTCGKKRKVTPMGKDFLCQRCKQFLDLIENDQETIEKLYQCANLGSEEIVPVSHADEHELPEVLDAVRYRTTDRERNKWYVSVSELEGEPVEIFASTAFDRDQHLQSRISNLTTITRLISLILRHIFMGERLTLEKTLTQLYRSSRQPNDLPDMLGRVLSNYSKTTPEPDKDKPESIQ